MDLFMGGISGQDGTAAEKIEDGASIRNRGREVNPRAPKAQQPAPPLRLRAEDPGAGLEAAAVRRNGEPVAAEIADRDVVAAPAEVLEDEPVPRRVGERIDAEAAVAVRDEAAQARDHEVAEGRVVVVLAALADAAFAPDHRARDPVGAVGVEDSVAASTLLTKQ